MSHHGAARPDVKNSAVLDPARRASTTAGMNEMTMEAATMTQSRDVRRMSELVDVSTLNRRGRRGRREQQGTEVLFL